MATITYTATHPITGASSTRSTGTMAYTHAVIDANGGTYSWHLTENAAHRAAQKQGAKAVPAVPTAINGKLDLERVKLHPNYVAIVELFQAKVMGIKVEATPAHNRRAVEQRKVATGADVLASATAAAAQLEWTGKEHGHRVAQGTSHLYRITKNDVGCWYTAQRGQRGAWTPVGGACATQRQAESLAQRYEGGERQLSHRANQGVAFVNLPKPY